LNLRPLRPERGTTVRCRAVEHGRWRSEHDSGASGSSGAVAWARVCSFFCSLADVLRRRLAVARQRNKERRAAPMGWRGTPLLAGNRGGGRSTEYDRTCLINVRSFRHLGAPLRPEGRKASDAPCWCPEAGGLGPAPRAECKGWSPCGRLATAEPGAHSVMDMSSSWFRADRCCAWSEGSACQCGTGPVSSRWC
jgi:hypothetical protein